MDKKSKKAQEWIVAQRRHRLSNAQVQMARELGINPRSLGGMDNHKQEPWKAPLPVFIEELYWKRFKKERPDQVVSIAERSRRLEEKKKAKRERKALRRAERAAIQAPHMIAGPAASGAVFERQPRSAVLTRTAPGGIPAEPEPIARVSCGDTLLKTVVT